MSFSTTNINDLKVGTFVKVTAVASAMRLANGYNGGSDRGDVKQVNRVDTFSFRLEGDRTMSGWLKPEFVEVVTGSEFNSDIDLDGDELICTSSGYSFWTVGETYTVAYGDSCGDEDCCPGRLGLLDDDGDFCDDGDPDITYINITRIKREMTEPSVTTAVAVVELAPPVPVPAPEPAPTPIVNFGDLSDEDKAELLLAKHEGKPLQMHNKWVKRWQFVEDAKWAEDLAYRVEPREVTEARLKVDAVSKEYTSAIDVLKDLNKAA